LGGDQWWAGGVRLVLIALAALLSAAFFVLLPRRETWMTTLGQYTMYVYLLHSFVLYPLRESGVLRGEEIPELYLVGMLVFSLLIAIVLSSGPVRKLFRPIVEPKPKWIFTDHRDAPPGPSRRDPTGAQRVLPPTATPER
jgi:fucose 4-O-acetylase-like acetyltransferase